jgi:hypothetical protein
MKSLLAERRCLECGLQLQDDQRFCSRCGQRTDLERLTLGEIGHQLMHALMHADRSVVALLRSLFLRPGFVAREYVFGKRRRYFGPFATLVILLGVSTLLSELVGFESITSRAQLNGLQNFINRHVDVVVFLQVPLLALLCRMLFRRDRFNFAEHSVLVAYTFCLRAILFIFFVLPYVFFFHPSTGLVGYLLWALWSVYFGVAAAQFYTGNRLASWLKGMMAAAIIYPTTAGVINGLSWAYDQLKPSG